MDYEKKYNEAMERAKKILCNLGEGDGGIRDIETIFPELAESEEDERIKSCIGLALTDADEQRFKDFGTTLKDCLAWLKSLRPSWKPSGEQMKALLNIEGDLRAFQYNDKAKIIAELYEQLKRLL